MKWFRETVAAPVLVGLVLAGLTGAWTLHGDLVQLTQRVTDLQVSVSDTLHDHEQRLRVLEAHRPALAADAH